MKQKPKILAALAVASSLIFASCSNSDSAMPEKVKNSAIAQPGEGLKVEVYKIDPEVLDLSKGSEWGEGLEDQIGRSGSGLTLCEGADTETGNVEWNGGVIHGCQEEYVVVHYTGTITAPGDAGQSRSVVMTMAADDGNSLSIDGNSVIDSWVAKGCTNTTGELTMEAGKPVAIDAWYFQFRGGSCAGLYWQIDGSEIAVIPPSAFTPGDVEAPETSVAPEEETTTTVAGEVSTSDAGFGPNLVVNPSNEEGTNGWSYTGDVYVGNGFGYENGEWQRPRSGTAIAATSYWLGTRSQTVSLSSESDEYLDTSPEIAVSTWFNGRCGGRFFMRAELLDADGNVLDAKNVGSEGDLQYVHESDWEDQSWVQHAVSFTGYPAGARSVRYTDGGQDSCWWAGYYGGQMDDTEIRVKANSSTTSVEPATPVEVTTTTVADDKPLPVDAPTEVVVDDKATDFTCTEPCINGFAAAAGLPNGEVSVSVDGGAPIALTGANSVPLSADASSLVFTVASDGKTKDITVAVKRTAVEASDTTVAPAEESDTTVAAETDSGTSDDSSGSSPILWIIIALIVIAVIAYLVRRSQASKA
jgi:hypothetical protein